VIVCCSPVSPHQSSILNAECRRAVKIYIYGPLLSISTRCAAHFHTRPITSPPHPTHTQGYTKHPQLARWRACAQPLVAIGMYLSIVCMEGQIRKSSLILHPHPPVPLSPSPALPLGMPLPPPSLPPSSMGSTTTTTATTTTTMMTTTTAAADALGPLLEVGGGRGGVVVFAPFFLGHFWPFCPSAFVSDYSLIPPSLPSFF